LFLYQPGSSSISALPLEGTYPPRQYVVADKPLFIPNAYCTALCDHLDMLDMTTVQTDAQREQLSYHYANMLQHGMTRSCWVFFSKQWYRHIIDPLILSSLAEHYRVDELDLKDDFDNVYSATGDQQELFELWSTSSFGVNAPFLSRVLGRFQLLLG
jgi:hypothetical protein